MPCYKLVLLAKPDTTPETLATLFRAVATVVFRESGQFRSVQNFGVRPLAYPVRRFGQKYEEARWVHALFDVAPTSLAAVGAAIQSEKAVLQYRALLDKGPLAAFSPSTRVERKKRFSDAMRLNGALFDPDTAGVAPAAGERQ